jgi:hypothetical protein
MRFLSSKKRRFALSAVIFVWNAVLVKRTVRKEQFFSMQEMDVGVPLELFKERLMERLPRAVVRMKTHIATSTVKYKRRGSENTR